MCKTTNRKQHLGLKTRHICKVSQNCSTINCATALYFYFFLPCIVYTNNFKQTTFQKDVASLQKDNSSILIFLMLLE